MKEQLDQKPEVIAFIDTFIEYPSGYVLLSGKNGTGKSYCALAIYHEITPYRLPSFDHDVALFITQADLNLQWGKEIAKWGDCSSMLEQVCKPRLLVLDDLGTRTPSEPFMDFLYSLADKRYSERETKGTIITTNLNVKDMREKFGDAFVSRVASGTCFRFEGSDRRFKEK